jgi:hypothetical protein
VALGYSAIMSKMKGAGYMGMMEDYFGPPSEKVLKADGSGRKRKGGKERTDID